MIAVDGARLRRLDDQLFGGFGRMHGCMGKIGYCDYIRQALTVRLKLSLTKGDHHR